RPQDGLPSPTDPLLDFSVVFGFQLLPWPGQALTDDIIADRNNGHTTFDDGDGKVFDMTGQSAITAEQDPTAAGLGWQLTSRDPAEIDILPEPGAIVIWSLGAIGLCIPA